MGLHTVPVRLTVDTIRKWLDAIEKRDTDEARYYAHEVNMIGRMLTTDPEFREIFRKASHRCVSPDADAALDCMGEFLTALTDAAAPNGFRAPGPKIRGGP